MYSPLKIHNPKKIHPIITLDVYKRQVDDIANCALFLASDKSDFITGQVISPNGGFVI